MKKLFVSLAEKQGKPMNELTREDFQGVDRRFSKDVLDVFDFEKSVETRTVKGGTSRKAVLEQIEELREALGEEWSEAEG